MIPDTEVWRPVRGFEGVYEVSFDGKVRRIAPGRGAKVGRILKPTTNRKVEGYLFLFLYRECKSTRHYVHRIVAEAFHGPAPEGQEVNHIDGDKLNCCASNLEWVTKQENARHAVHVLKRGNRGKCGALNPASRRYVVYPPEGGEIQVHGLQNFCRKRGLDAPSMVNVASGRYRHHKGWRCERVEKRA